MKAKRWKTGFDCFGGMPLDHEDVRITEMYNVPFWY